MGDWIWGRGCVLVLVWLVEGVHVLLGGDCCGDWRSIGDSMGVVIAVSSSINVISTIAIGISGGTRVHRGIGYGHTISICINISNNMRIGIGCLMATGCHTDLWHNLGYVDRLTGHVIYRPSRRIGTGRHQCRHAVYRQLITTPLRIHTRRL